MLVNQSRLVLTKYPGLMHISEGILSAPILVSGAALSLGGTIIGLKKLDYDRIMGVAMLSSTFFVASLIHVPAGIFSVHLLLNGLMGLILGWSAFPAILVALTLQAVFFQYGGFLVLGVNTFTIAAPAVLCGLLFRPLLMQQGKKLIIAAFCAGFFSICLSAMTMAAALYLNDHHFLKTAWLLILSHLPVMIVEGLITLFIVRFLVRVQPDILGLSSPPNNLDHET